MHPSPLRLFMDWWTKNLGCVKNEIHVHLIGVVNRTMFLVFGWLQIAPFSAVAKIECWRACKWSQGLRKGTRGYNALKMRCTMQGKIREGTN